MSSHPTGIELLEQIDRLDREAREVYQRLVLPTWGTELHGFPDTLYGFMMGVFARIDLVSAYGEGSYSEQTKRMIGFMDEFLGYAHEANVVAVKMWRHKLMHTSQPRPLHDRPNGVIYRWLLHWWEHLPEQQHFTITHSGADKILNFGLIYLIRDLRAGAQMFLNTVQQDHEALLRFQAVEQ